MILLMGFLLQAAAGGAADPLGPAFHGQAQCYAPDVARKACASVGEYAKGADGRIQNTAITLLSPEPTIVMRTVAPVEVKAGAVCGQVTARDLATATFVVNGQPATEAAAEAVRRAIGPAYEPLLNREICTSYVQDGEAMKGLVSIDGTRRPELDQRVRWVSPSEGFTVKP